ncbi:hypothetical protein RHGRI_037464 [Rhododendron griersonianum]|uniref:F-box domain-containing protein n=1 Tax=Rhododendron griersonianum TaxID=479676 RepID=A0AAV6HVT0_9ERIC|nr:hypothetical protein RHGRI_037464 [Rhododendron griersonianum]
MSTESDHDPGSVDRIGELPEPLLVHILSFLQIEDAVKTQVLSKRWKYLCSFIPSLVFRSDSVDRDIYEFAEFVNNTLTLCNCTRLKKFAVVCRFYFIQYYETKVNLWTRFAAGKGTEILHLDFHRLEEYTYEESCYELPQHLYSNSSFRELHFSSCSVTPKAGVDWNSLKKLSIGYVGLSDEVIQKILVGSPVLEILELYYFHGVSRLHFGNASLKKLILREYWDNKCDYFDGNNNNLDDSQLEISAPNLQSLEMLGCLGRKDCRLVDVSSLVDATLDFDLRHEEEDVLEDYERDQNMLRRLVERLAHVKSTIKLGTVNNGSERFALSTVEHFGETLTKLCDFDEKLYWTSQKRAYKCLMLHLTKVKFAGVRWLYRDLNFAFVQFLLENARVLQKMVIDALRDDDVKPTTEFFQKLLSFPRSSPNAVVMFYE